MSTAASGEPVTRFSFSSRDEEEITEFMRQVYVDQDTRFARAPERARFESETADVPGIGADQLRSTIDYTQTTDPFDYFLSFVVRGGTVRVRSAGGEASLRPGDVVACPIGAPIEFDMKDMHLSVIRMPISRIEAVAGEASSVPAAEFKFDGMRPTSPAMARFWRHQVGLVSGSLMEHDSPMSSPLLVEEMARLTALAALHVFPNTAMSRHYSASPGDVAPAAVRRAVAHIDAHADEPVTLHDIAAAAGTGVRALQHGFRRHLDTTPLAYLRRVRLERAHRALQAADPARGDTVAAIAAAWGFAKPDRFAAAYRQAYGVLPSHTLRT